MYNCVVSMFSSISPRNSGNLLISSVVIEQRVSLNICPTSASDDVWVVQPFACGQGMVTGGRSG